VPKTAAPKRKATPCDPCSADAFVDFEEALLQPSFHSNIAFNPPQGQRLVIEFVTAFVEVPAGESARVRMVTGFSTGQAGNFDLALTPQGIVNGLSIYVATHAVRAYTGGFLWFVVQRDNAVTTGYALVSVSGYGV
jgi:hypothetical protein